MDHKLEEAQCKVDQEEAEKVHKEHEKKEYKEQVIPDAKRKHNEEAIKAKKRCEDAAQDEHDKAATAVH